MANDYSIKLNAWDVVKLMQIIKSEIKNEPNAANKKKLVELQKKVKNYSKVEASK